MTNQLDHDNLRSFSLPARARDELLAKCLIQTIMPSNVIAHMDYDEATETLKIRFVSGVEYEYIKVPLTIFHELKNSREKGVYLNQYIKKNFDYKKINT